MNKTKIDWCDCTWNPVWGCLNKCNFCYARKIAKRFAKNMTVKEFGYLEKNFARPKYSHINSIILYDKHDFYNSLDKFLPTFIISNFEKSFPKRHSRIFVNSMSEIYFWEEEWMELVLNKIKKYPQHIFMFLTKFPQVYFKYSFPKNCWLGITITNKWDIKTDVFDFLRQVKNLKFISFEPLFSEIPSKIYIRSSVLEIFSSIHIDWVIIGSQTNPYKPPKREWVEKIIKEAKKGNIPVFLKNNLYRAYSNLPVLKEFPLKLEDYVAYAYNQIKDRKGKIINGQFVKEEKND